MGLRAKSYPVGGSYWLTGRLLGSSFTAQSPELVSEKKMWPLCGIALQTMGEFAT